MTRINQAVEAVCEYAILVCGMLLIGSAAFVSADLICRKILNISLVGANEISGYVLAISSAWAFSYTLLRRSHIRIDIIYRHLPHRLKAVIDIVSVAALAALAGAFVYFAFKYVNFVWTRGSRSITSLAMPLWIPMFFWLLGWVIFFAVSIYLTAVSAAAFLRGEHGRIQQLVGSISEDEEVALELDGDANEVGRHVAEKEE